MMRRPILWCGVLLLLAVPVRAETTAPKVLSDEWHAAYFEGAKAGFFRSTVQEVDHDGARVLRTSLSMNLAVKRYGSVVNLRLTTGTEETPTGQVVGLFLTHFLDQGKVVQTGRVEGDELVVSTPTDGEGKRVPWDGRVLGLRRQQELFRERKVKPGDRFMYRNYELMLLRAVPVTVTVKEPEEVDLLKEVRDGDRTRVERVKRKLLRVEAVPGKVRVGDGDIQLPGMVSWLDADREVVRSEFQFPGLGRVTVYRTTRAVAEQAGVAPALLPDLGLTTLIPLKQRIDRPQDARAVVYRVTLKGDDDPGTTFARDARQEVRNVKDGSFELVIRPVREPAAVEAPGRPDAKYLESSYFLDCANPKVKALAARVVGHESDPWKKARLVERWVHENMKPSSAVGFATASQTARDLQGDCRQHAMLTAALCRAAGVPARTAVGLIYVDDPDRGPVLGFHMWTEVWVSGQWLGLDATLGQGSVGAGHLKIADHSWHDTQTLAPLLPVTRVMGKVGVEVVSVE
jgi:transglutaminase-like putative cysteine protease